MRNNNRCKEGRIVASIFIVLLTPVIFLILLAAFDKTIIFVPFNTNAVVYVLGCSFDKEEKLAGEDNPVDKDKLSQKIKSDLNKDGFIEVIEIKIISVESKNGGHPNPDTPNC